MIKWGILTAIVIILLDQVSKYYVLTFLAANNDQPIELLPFFRIVLVYNQGVSFGMFNGIEYGRYILTAVSALITLILIYWLFTTQEKPLILALCLIIGGAIGNMIDRVRQGAVTDFIDVFVGTYHWPAFNIADSAIFIGVACLCFEQLWCHRKDKLHAKTL